ncbi:receptor-type tyrosine-protein phosphatase kappa [Plakobranchus ocellatus]|uniref:Receptor-type tyrosine-protein phosphatase kappa n=1 Tax=Plakobranchus ocellatus TaxID=259542 RepID=A0AAV4D7Z5_9GAST|nr:receptor-type tyrosine-protein phosphatase kappa [Plakobranchus ocellatus]
MEAWLTINGRRPAANGRDARQNCPRGRYGPGCSLFCNANCAGQGDPCHHVDGTCTQGCDPGYQGSHCEQACDQGTYGQDCNETCANTCGGVANTCNHVNGTCDLDCDPGYVGALCDVECPAGMFGLKCEGNCSTHCAGKDNACNHVDGTCSGGCDPGYRTAQCNVSCDQGTYGQDCNETCANTCAGESNSCNYMNGTCDQGCKQGYVGALCDLEAEQVGGGGDGAGEALIPAVAGASAAVIVIVAIIAILLWMRHTRSKHSTLNGISESTSDTEIPYANFAGHTFNTKADTLPTASVVTKKNEAYEDETDDDIETAILNAVTGDASVPMEQLKAYLHVHSSDSHFKDQFTAIPLDLGKKRMHGLSVQNSKKNRYKNIFPYDDTRVLLKVDERKKLTDYINASYIRDYDGSEAIIASQAPNEVILNDFVRMLWEQGVDRMVMLTNLIEMGKAKCTMYWPEDGEKDFGDFKIQLLTIQMFAEYTIRHLQLRKGNEPPRDLTHFHFTAWPDKSVPENPWGLVDFYHRVMASPSSGTLLVHCSAGVGRSGTFIALCNALREAEATGKVDFRSILLRLRQDRMHMIQTLGQYTFLHKAVLVGHMTSGTTIKVSDLPARFRSLEGGASGDKSARSYQQEFDELAAVCDDTTAMSNAQSDEDEHIYGNQQFVVKKQKDRLGNILPNRAYRPDLIPDDKDMDTYINAVLVPNLVKKSQDILTQLPLPSTVNDFWRLVTQYRVSHIVAFEVDTKVTDETIGDFLPESETEPLDTDRFEIRSTTVAENFAVKEMSVTVRMKDMQGPSSSNDQRTLTCLLCKNTTLDAEDVLELVAKIKACKSSETSRTIYMCRLVFSFYPLTLMASGFR